MRRRARFGGRWITVATMVAAMAAMAGSAAATPTTTDEMETEAILQGRLIDMSEDWGAATACMVWPEELVRPECFRTEAEMDARIAELEGRDAASGALPSVGLQSEAAAASGTNCSGYLRLYDGTSYTGAALYVRGRYQWLDLAPFNFDQKTSSFKIGPCSAYFADLTGGGGSWYPTGDTQAYDVATSMITGWDNDVSSLYIT